LYLLIVSETLFPLIYFLFCNKILVEVGVLHSRMYSICTFSNFFVCGTGALTQGLLLKTPHQPYFCEGFFEIGSLELFGMASNCNLPDLCLLTS
jgi:hypothetical protein